MARSSPSHPQEALCGGSVPAILRRCSSRFRRWVSSSPARLGTRTTVRAPPPRHETSAGDRGVTARERAYRSSYASIGLLQSRYVKLIILTLAIAVLLLGFAIGVLFHSHPSFVQVQAETEVFRLDTSAGEPIAWPISGFKALRFDERGRARQADLREASTLELPRGTRVEVTRAGERGPLRINLARIGDAPPDGAWSGA